MTIDNSSHHTHFNGTYKITNDYLSVQQVTNFKQTKILSIIKKKKHPRKTNKQPLNKNEYEGHEENSLPGTRPPPSTLLTSIPKSPNLSKSITAIISIA